MSGARAVVLLLATAVLIGCGVRPRAVVQRPPGSAERGHHAQTRAHTHVVVRGDTLYGIAFRNGLDYRDLARWNGIGAPYTIHPGQHLSLVPKGAVAAPAPRASSIASVPARATGTTPPAGQSSSSAPAPQVRAAPAPAPVGTPPQAPANTPVTAPAASQSVQGIVWRWPANGQLIGRFVAGDPTRQGIGVAGSAGQAIVAAADGEVVYSGSGLIGYGELVIIRHSDDFLSAYGHNRKRLVDEGQTVKAGQQIAEMGRTGASRDMLHFEIRRSGKPVDPLAFLPPR